jgi:hypothetical protein
MHLALGDAREGDAARDGPRRGNGRILCEGNYYGLQSAGTSPLHRSSIFSFRFRNIHRTLFLNFLDVATMNEIMFVWLVAGAGLF